MKRKGDDMDRVADLSRDLQSLLSVRLKIKYNLKKAARFYFEFLRNHIILHVDYSCSGSIIEGFI